MIEFEINTNKKQIDFDITQGIPKYVPANFQSKTVIPTTEQQIVRADIGYDGLEQVTVEKINLSNKTITENGTYNAETDNLNGYSSVEVNVQPTLQEKSITITENGTTEVIADSGYDGLSKVSVEANVKDNSLLNAIKGLNSYNTSNYPFELTADMFDENSTEIYQYKYAYNKNITKVEIPSTMTKTGSYIFYECRNLTSVIIGNGVTNIGYHAFDGCSSLTSITIPDSVTSIVSGAFNNCSSLTNITIPDSVTSIESRVFYGCMELININIPDGVTSLGEYLFYRCKITNITMPISLKSLGNGVFYLCEYLNIVDFRNVLQIPTLANTNAFQSVPTSCKFIIPDELYDSWITATNWSAMYTNGYQFIKASEYTEA